jgi:hypothetical protein
MHAVLPVVQCQHLSDRSPRVQQPIGSGVASLLVVVGLGFAALPPASAGTIYWDMQTLAATSSDVAGLVVGDMTRGNGGISTLTGTASTSKDYSFLLAGTSTPASGGNNVQSSALGGPLVTGSSAYFAISLSNTSSYVMKVVGVGFGSRSTSTGPAAYALRSSLDGYTAHIAGGTSALPTDSIWAYYANTFSSPLEIAPATAAQIRLYGFGGTADSLNNTTWRIDDLQVIVVPEPAVWLANAVSICLTAAAGRAKRRRISRPSRT